MLMTHVGALLGTILTELLRTPALAFTVTNAIDAVSPGMPGGAGSTFGGILLTVAQSFIPVAAIAATLAMTLSGFFLAISGNENQTTTARRVFISSLSGLALINVAPIFASSLISSSGTILSAPVAAAVSMQEEALGIVAFLEAPLGILCVVMIIISGIRAIANFGSEDGVAQLRRTVLFVVAGFILVYTRSLIGVGVASGTPYSVINVALSVVNRIIGLTILIAIAMVVYAGILMIVNVGRDEQYGKAKGLLLRVAIGLVVMIASGGIIYFLTGVIR